MTKKIIWNKVTPLSKTVAMIMFASFPLIGFYLGIQYQKRLDKPYMNSVYEVSNPSDSKHYACTMEAKLCPDGVTYVGRSGPKCEFDKCPGEK